MHISSLNHRYLTCRPMRHSACSPRRGAAGPTQPGNQPAGRFKCYN